MISFANTKRVGVRYKDTWCCGEVNDQNGRVRRTGIPDERPREGGRGRGGAEGREKGVV